MIKFNKYIEINMKKRFGKPIIKGTRISVYDVLSWLSCGMSRKEISSSSSYLFLTLFFTLQI